MEVTLSKEEVSGEPQYWRCLRGTQYWGAPVLEGPELKREGAGARVWPTLQVHVLWVSKVPSVSFSMPLLLESRQKARQAQLRVTAFTDLT